MRGIYIENFYETLKDVAELEFEYQNGQYVIQPLVIDDKYWLTIWKIIDDKHGICMIKEEIHSEEGIEKEVIDKVLNARCFDGKSFFEIYNDIEIIFWG